MTGLREALVVDCDEQNLELSCVLLEEAGVAVRPLADARGLLRAVVEQPPDVVLLEMRLPDVDAVELVRELRAAPELAGLPVVAVTAAAMRGDRERFLAAGCDGYIAKPYETATFVEQLDGIVAAVADRSRGPGS